MQLTLQQLLLHVNRRTWSDVERAQRRLDQWEHGVVACPEHPSIADHRPHSVSPAVVAASGEL